MAKAGQRAHVLRRIAPSPEPTKAALAKGFILHFFLNLNLAADADPRLAPSGFGRPHHRTLLFATYTPGLTVSELLQALKVTHQNLRIPIRQLLDGGYMVAKLAKEDRRHKRLYATAKGRKLVEALTAVQFQRLVKAFELAGPDAVRGFMDVHEKAIEASDKVWVNRMSDSFGKS